MQITTFLPNCVNITICLSDINPTDNPNKIVVNEYTLFQNGRHFSILLFDCKLALLASFRVKYSFEFYV